MSINGSIALKSMLKKHKYIKKLLRIKLFLSTPKSFDRFFNIDASANYLFK